MTTRTRQTSTHPLDLLIDEAEQIAAMLRSPIVVTQDARNGMKLEIHSALYAKGVPSLLVVTEIEPPTNDGMVYSTDDVQHTLKWAAVLFGAVYCLLRLLAFVVVPWWDGR